MPLVMTASVRLRTMLQIDEAARATNQLFRARMSMPTGRESRQKFSVTLDKAASDLSERHKAEAEVND